MRFQTKSQTDPYEERGLSGSGGGRRVDDGCNFKKYRSVVLIVDCRESSESDLFIVSRWWCCR